MGTRQVPLCWPEPVCSVSGYSSMSLVSAPSGHAEGTDTLQSLVISGRLAQPAAARTTAASPSPGPRPPTNYSRTAQQVKELRSHDTS
jgi:hypothetical protein